jgi:formylglycine-generating enzyme required for sulfatase activity
MQFKGIHEPSQSGPHLHSERIARYTLCTFVTIVALGTLIAQEAHAGRKPGAAFKDCATVCPEMVVLPPGEFLMGSPSDVGTKHELPVHTVTIARAFAVSRYEVTFEEWDACVADGSCSHQPDDRGWGRGRQPVINVSWQDAKQYAGWLARKTGLSYRLLTEAEWEYAARAGTTTRFYFGDDEGLLDDYGWSAYSSGNRTQPVGKKKPNGFGLHDMHGNASEWVEDPWHNTYEEAPIDGSAWMEGGDFTRRVVRGGSWHTKPGWLRSAFRWGSIADSRSFICGFRLARDLDP